MTSFTASTIDTEYSIHPSTPDGRMPVSPSKDTRRIVVENEDRSVIVTDINDQITVSSSSSDIVIEEVLKEHDWEITV